LFPERGFGVCVFESNVHFGDFRHGRVKNAKSVETDFVKTSASKNPKQKSTRIEKMDNRKRMRNQIGQRKP